MADNIPKFNSWEDIQDTSDRRCVICGLSNDDGMDTPLPFIFVRIVGHKGPFWWVCSPDCLRALASNNTIDVNWDSLWDGYDG